MSADGRSRVLRVGLHVEGYLRSSRFPEDFEDMFRDGEGRPLSAEAARDALRNELAEGKRVLPCSSDCSNPCANADKGCTGFDYAGRGCPGYLVDKA